MSKDGVDYICITDIARQKNLMDPNGVIANWMRNRNTIEFLGIWETLYNPAFNPLEFEGFRQLRSGGSPILNSREIYVIMPRLISLFACPTWRTLTPCLSTMAFRRQNDSEDSMLLLFSR